MNYKRSMHNQPVQTHPSNDALSTIGMRIRNAVNGGYKVDGNQTNNYSNPYLNNGLHNAYYTGNQGQQQVQQQQAQPQRGISLPNNLSQPPALSGSGSTFDSGSNLSEWETRSTPITTLPSVNTGVNLKRRRDDFDEPNFDSNKSSVESADKYLSKYGQLSFDEEF